VIIADFGHGFLTKEKIDEIEDRANYITLNTQNNSGNMGMNTINKYSKWGYASIDEIELRLACSNQFEDIKQLLHEKFNGTDKIVSVTENKNGSYVYKDKKIIHTPAYARDIVDTVGAGDAYFALTSPLAYLNAPADVIGNVGNIAGAIACSYPGNKEHVTKERLYGFKIR
jgi:sugar/nucleoside kinase (ribokinase family)